ncbi:MAG: hypothetical protein D6744_01160 [Planctomycetota bacterium]|nr:MAG: hypothetical protein D6744_01160 [Planctomycetota bacterium]
MHRQRVRTHKRIQQVFDVPANTPAADVLRHVLEAFHSRGEPPSHALMQFVAMALESPDALGAVFVGSPDPPSNDLVPIQAPFEPRPLDELDHSFITLRNGLLQSEQSTDEPSSFTEEDRSQEQRLTWRRWHRAIFPWLPALVLVTWFTKSWLTLLLFCALFALTASLRIAYVLTQPRDKLDPHNARWMLVPGGLLLMSPRRGSTKWNLHVFDRRASVLIAYVIRGVKGAYTVVVADRDHSASRDITDVELDMLLRAWISPLPPPDVERLAELTAT